MDTVYCKYCRHYNILAAFFRDPLHVLTSKVHKTKCVCLCYGIPCNLTCQPEFLGYSMIGDLGGWGWDLCACVCVQAVVVWSREVDGTSCTLSSK